MEDSLRGILMGIAMIVFTVAMGIAWSTVESCLNLQTETEYHILEQKNVTFIGQTGDIEKWHIEQVDNMKVKKDG